MFILRIDSSRFEYVVCHMISGWIKFYYIIPTYSRITRNLDNTENAALPAFSIPITKHQITPAAPTHPRNRSMFSRHLFSAHAKYIYSIFIQYPDWDIKYIIMLRVYALFTHVAQFDPLSGSGNRPVPKPPEWPPSQEGCEKQINVLDIDGLLLAIEQTRTSSFSLANNNSNFGIPRWNISAQNSNTNTFR